jgi:hypothetical protein
VRGRAFVVSLAVLALLFQPRPASASTPPNIVRLSFSHAPGGRRVALAKLEGFEFFGRCIDAGSGFVSVELIAKAPHRTSVDFFRTDGADDTAAVGDTGHVKIAGGTTKVLIASVTTPGHFERSTGTIMLSARHAMVEIEVNGYSDGRTTSGHSPGCFIAGTARGGGRGVHAFKASAPGGERTLPTVDGFGLQMRCNTVADTLAQVFVNAPSAPDVARVATAESEDDAGVTYHPYHVDLPQSVSQKIIQADGPPGHFDRVVSDVMLVDDTRVVDVVLNMVANGGSSAGCSIDGTAIVPTGSSFGSMALSAAPGNDASIVVHGNTIDAACIDDHAGHIVTGLSVSPARPTLANLLSIASLNDDPAQTLTETAGYVLSGPSVIDQASATSGNFEHNRDVVMLSTGRGVLEIDGQFIADNHSPAHCTFEGVVLAA